MSSYKYFLKGDISGIQDFIFNVKSEGAAKSLKGRSFFIQALSLIGQQMIEDTFKKENVEQFYNGGGNFYLLLKSGDLEQIQELQRRIDAFCISENFHLTLSAVSLINRDLENDFGSIWQELNRKSDIDKLKKFSQSPEGFKTYQPTSDLNWKALTKFLKRKSYSLIKNGSQDFNIGENGVEVFGYHLTNGENGFQDVVLELPRWNKDLINQNREMLEREQFEREGKDPDYRFPSDGMIIEFSYLAGFAKERTGTGKIGILKMDVDSLGKLFSKLSFSTAKKVSELMTDFFGTKINQFLETEIINKENSLTPKKFGENIYTVFSGGDDCFFVGAWDAVFQWTKLVQTEFSGVSEILTSLSKSAISEKDFADFTEKKILPVTVSAGLVMLEPTYPVVRFADLTNEALDDAKGFKYYNEEFIGKNKITVLDEILEWSDFKSALEIACFLESLVRNHDEPTSTIEKLRRTSKSFKSLHKASLKGKYPTPGVSMLYYAIRNSKNNGELTNKVITPYAKDLISAFVNGKQSNPMKFPLAARIAEFSTRNK